MPTATNLAEMLALKRVSQTELAKRLGLDQSTVSRQVTRGIYDIRTAQKYAAVLKCRDVVLLETE